jgi:hypothetical protein
MMEAPPLKYFISALWENCISGSTHLQTLFASSVCRCFLHLITENSVGHSLSSHIISTSWRINIKSKYDIEIVFVMLYVSLVRCSHINSLHTLNSLATIPSDICYARICKLFHTNLTTLHIKDKYIAHLRHILCELCWIEISFWASHHIMSTRACLTRSVTSIAGKGLRLWPEFLWLSNHYVLDRWQLAVSGTKIYFT